MSWLIRQQLHVDDSDTNVAGNTMLTQFDLTEEATVEDWIISTRLNPSADKEHGPT
jgi:hypothetical protein